MVYIIIVGFNNQKDVLKCVQSIQSSTYKKIKICLVDNNSRDNTVAIIHKKYPEVAIIANPKNYGFAAGNNIGIKAAIYAKSDYIFFLNADAEIDKNCINQLIKASKGQKIVQPLIYLKKNGRRTKLINTAGTELHYLGFSYCSHYRKKANSNLKTAIATASGAAMLIPTKIIQKIGFFDEHFFMYFEDVDLCWRAQLLNQQILLVPEACVWHKYEFGRAKEKFYFVERNRLFFILKNYELTTIIKILPMGILTEIAICFYTLKNRWFGQKLKSYLVILSRLVYIFHQRNEIQAKRVKTDGELFSFFIKEISFKEVPVPGLKYYNKLSKWYWDKINDI